MKILKISDGKKVFIHEPRYNIINLQKQLFDATKSAQYYFEGCDLESVDALIEYSDTENVTNMSNMFYYCKNLQTIPQLNTTNVTLMQNMFSDCTNLQTVPQLNTSNVTSMYSMFSDCSNLQTIPELNTSNVTNMYSMFTNCYKLQTIPQLNTSNVTNMMFMFYYCKNLQTIPQLNTSNVTRMRYMFYNCTNLQSIPQLDTSNVTDMYNMFKSCYNLQTIDITSLDKISSTSNISCFAAYCYSLTKLIIRNMTVIPPLDNDSFSTCYHFIGTVNSTYNPNGLKDGRIYVPDNMVDSLKSATNWSNYADIIVPLSTLEE